MHSKTLATCFNMRRIFSSLHYIYFVWVPDLQNHEKQCKHSLRSHTIQRQRRLQSFTNGGGARPVTSMGRPYMAIPATPSRLCAGACLSFRRTPPTCSHLWCEWRGDSIRPPEAALGRHTSHRRGRRLPSAPLMNQFPVYMSRKIRKFEG